MTDAPNRVVAERGQVTITSAQGFPLWHLPVDEAARMTPAQLRAEVRAAVRANAVDQKEVWAGLRKAKARMRAHV